MMPTLRDLMAPDMQKILAFLLPTILSIAALVLNMSRGFSTVGTVFMFTCAVIAIYFAPDFFRLL